MKRVLFLILFLLLASRVGATLPATDDFTGSDANPIGGNWTTAPGAAAFKRLNNQAVGTDANFNGSYWNADTFSNDQCSEVTVVTPVDAGPAVRITTTGTTQNYYWIDVHDTSTVKLYKFVNGNGLGSNQIQIGSNYTETNAANDTWKLCAVGTTLTLYHNGAQLSPTQTDSTFTSGAAGFSCYSACTLDNWTGSNAGGSPPPPPPPPVCTICLVQQTGGDCNTGNVPGNSCSVDFLQNVGSGHFLIYVVRVGATKRTLTLTDSKSNTIVTTLSTVEDSNGDALFVRFVENSLPGTTSVTASVSGGTTTIRLAIHEYSGLATSSSLDQHAAAAGSSTSIASGSFTTTEASELLFAAALTQNASVYSPGATFNVRQTVGGTLTTADNILTATGTKNCTFTLDTTGPWAVICASFGSSPLPANRIKVKAWQ